MAFLVIFLLFDQLKLAPKQSELILALLQLQEEDQEWVKITQLKKRIASPSGILRTLLDKGLLEERFVQENRSLLPKRKPTDAAELSNRHIIKI